MNYLEPHQIPVAEAAELLEVHPSRVRAMIAHGQLDAQKLSGCWFINRRSVESKRHSSVAGRPFNEANAWALLCLSEGKAPDWVSRWELSRLRRRLREDGLEELAPRLRKRAVKKELRAHPSLLPGLKEDPRLFPSGVSMASEHQLDIVEPNEFEAYVSNQDFEEVVRDRYLQPSPNPNVCLHVADSKLLRKCADHSMGPVVSALDLLEADDEKSRRAGRQLISLISSALQGVDHDSDSHAR